MSDDKRGLNPATDRERVLETARQVCRNEADAITTLGDRLGEQFLQALKMLVECSGKVVVSGLGKSGIAGKKIAATLASTGAPAVFLHAAEAVHGDMGVVSDGDMAIMISYSGETHELVELMPRLRVLGVGVIAMTGNPASALASQADCVLDVSVAPHPWPFGILPTASNAATVAVGDALAVALLVIRGVREEDFALLHPGGLLGKKLLVTIGDIMHTGDELPVVRPADPMREVLVIITAKRLGVACVVDNGGRLEGIITDGDLRRLMTQQDDPLGLSAGEAMTAQPKTIGAGMLSAQALRIMESHAITSLPVVNDGGGLVGLVHMHDILKLETFK